MGLALVATCAPSLPTCSLTLVSILMASQEVGLEAAIL